MMQVAKLAAGARESPRTPRPRAPILPVALRPAPVGQPATPPATLRHLWEAKAARGSKIGGLGRRFNAHRVRSPGSRGTPAAVFVLRIARGRMRSTLTAPTAVFVLRIARGTMRSTLTAPTAVFVLRIARGTMQSTLTAPTAVFVLRIARGTTRSTWTGTGSARAGIGLDDAAARPSFRRADASDLTLPEGRRSEGAPRAARAPRVDPRRPAPPMPSCGERGLTLTCNSAHDLHKTSCRVPFCMREMRFGTRARAKQPGVTKCMFTPGGPGSRRAGQPAGGAAGGTRE
jgi:hypothetical protein